MKPARVVSYSVDCPTAGNCIAFSLELEDGSKAIYTTTLSTAAALLTFFKSFTDIAWNEATATLTFGPEKPGKGIAQVPIDEG